MSKNSYVGQLLVANPLNPKDSLTHSVILVVTHTSELSLGLQINRPILDLSMADVSDQVGVYVTSSEPIFYGGNMSPNKIHVIHSNEWQGLTTIPITDTLSVTNDVSVLVALSRGDGPEYWKACAGCWAWESGQLEEQLSAKPESKVRHRWELATADPEIVFDSGPSLDIWHRVIEAAAREQVSAWLNPSPG
jgi:putative transcriptional regulator